MFISILSMLTFALVGAITPGPVNLIATSSGASLGIRRSLLYVLGATLGYVLVVLVSGFGFGAFLESSPRLMAVLQYASVAFLLYLAYQIAFAPITDLQASDAQKAPNFWLGALVQILNPKAWLFAVSGVSLFVSTQVDTTVYLLVFASISFFMCFLGVGVWAVLGSVLQPILSQPHYQLWFNRCMGVLLASTTLTLLF